jgi:hypothetical protein
MVKATVDIQKQVSQAQLGTWLGPTLGIQSRLSYLVPYGKSREDMEVILRSQGLLGERQPIELSGFGLYTALPRALAIQDDLEEDGLEPYAVLTSHHPVLVSYPPDVLWLVKERGLTVLSKGMKRVLPRGIAGLGLSHEEAGRITDLTVRLASASSKSYSFWRAITATDYEGEALSSLLLEWSIANALLARAKAMAGLVPVIDSRTPGSVALAHTFNEAYGHVMHDREDEGRPTLAYLYTIGLNPNLVPRERWPGMLEKVVRNARAALEDRLYDGIHLSIRGLPSISNSRGRVATVYRLLDELSGVCQSAGLALWWSRPGIVGVGALDHGANYASFQLNLSFADVYYDGGPVDELPKYGKIYHPTKRELWDRNQVRRAMEGPDNGMPDLGPVRSRPMELELSSPTRYRVFFSKPYNMAALNDLAEGWWRSVDDSETRPGREYLQGTEAPFNQWGL